MPSRPPVAYLFTTFPKNTETFFQREIEGLIAAGTPLVIYSLWGGGGDFHGLKVRAFPKAKLLHLLWLLPALAWQRPAIFRRLGQGLTSRRPPSWINFWENLLGGAFAVIHAAELRQTRPSHLHAAWSAGPAAAAWVLARLDDHAYSAGAHAYDIYRHGGDWWLVEKLAHARFVHTSTDMARASLIARGVAPAKIHVVRRGLIHLPKEKPLRPSPRQPLQLLCVARLVPKKGIDRQLTLLAAARTRGLHFEIRLAGDGPQRACLERQTRALGLTDVVTFLGHRPQAEIAQLLREADALLHTGVVAADGDRDGLPNVIPEAMAAGVLVLTSPAAATTEAITEGINGRVLPVENETGWVDALASLVEDDATCERLRRAARTWVEIHFCARTNAARLATLHAETADSIKASRRPAS